MKEEWEEKWGFASNRFCLDNYPQEYPSYGYSDLRNPAYQVVNKFGNAVSRLVVKDYIIHNECAVQTDGMPCLFNKNKKLIRLKLYYMMKLSTWKCICIIRYLTSTI